MRTRPLLERFIEKINFGPGCWEWGAYRSRTGYGMIGLTRSRRVERTHRVAWMLSHGDIPDGLQVLHRCDNPACVRPSHLFLGTQVENIRDMDMKGRRKSLSGTAHPARRAGARTGARNGRARLTEDDVREIKRLRYTGMMYKDIAAKFGVATPTVQHIISGKNWSHV